MKMSTSAKLVLFLTYVTNSWGSITIPINNARAEEGQREFALMNQKAESPKYGKCWKNALVTIQTGCKRLDDEVQSRMALEYLNCFLALQGRPAYSCRATDSIQHCTKDMSEGDRGSYTTFFTHTQNICYFLESQIWQENTEKTVSRLSDSSLMVASQLEESSELQAKMIEKQNMSLINQETIIDKAINLSQIISTSSNNIHLMFDEFKETTQEQRLLITDVFDRVTKLQSTVLGEFSGFYSFIFYALSILICYMLTSTPRTNAARFWIFGVMTLNIVLERIILSYVLKQDELYGNPPNADNDTAVYENQWLCRKLSCIACLVVIITCAYRYKDLNKINNQLLVEIRKQNSDLKNFILSDDRYEFDEILSWQVLDMVSESQHQQLEVDIKDPITHNTIVSGSLNKDGGKSPTKPLTGFFSSTPEREMITSGKPDSPSSSLFRPISASADTTGYETDTGTDEESDSRTGSFMTDRTFNPTENCGGSTVSTPYSGDTSDGRSSEILSELRDIRSATPLKELANQISTWASTGLYGESSKSKTSPQETGHKYGGYCLRPRKTSAKSNPVVYTESPRTFSKTVRRLEKMAIKNSMMARYTIKRRNNIPDTSDDEY